MVLSSNFSLVDLQSVARYMHFAVKFTDVLLMSDDNEIGGHTLKEIISQID